MLKIQYPIFQIDQPSTGKMLNFRRYLVKDEKILLMAKESKTIGDIFRAIKQVVNNSCMEKDFKIDEIPLFDLEYIYLKLRANSVNNVEQFKIIDQQDKQEHTLFIVFDEIKVNFPEKTVDRMIKVDKRITLEMKYPKANLYDSEGLEASLRKDGIFELVLNLIDKIWNGEELVSMTPEEKKEFVDALDIKTFRQIENFLMNIPSVKYTVKYKNTLGNDREITFTSLIDFFIYL